MDLKEVKVTSLKQGMRLVNIGTVDHIDEYSNAVLVFLSFKKIKEEENKSFAKQTPGGTLQMWISYETQASDAFEQGKEYYLDILPIPSDYKQKMEAEKEELEVRLEKLNAFNQSEEANEIAPEQKSISRIQAGAMYTYLECLKESLARL